MLRWLYEMVGDVYWELGNWGNWGQTLNCELYSNAAIG